MPGHLLFSRQPCTVHADNQRPAHTGQVQADPRWVHCQHGNSSLKPGVLSELAALVVAGQIPSSCGFSAPSATYRLIKYKTCGLCHIICFIARLPCMVFGQPLWALLNPVLETSGQALMNRSHSRLRTVESGHLLDLNAWIVSFDKGGFLGHAPRPC